MNKDNLSRRTFIHDTSLASAATIAAAFAKPSHTAALSSDKKKTDTSKILNYNPNMGYRRLGKTGLMISEVSLGGHWRAPWRDRSGGWWWGQFANEQGPEDAAQKRTGDAPSAPALATDY